DEGKVLGHGSFGPMEVRIGSPIAVGEVRMPLRDVVGPRRDAGRSRARHIKLYVTVRGTGFANDWDCWVYPAELPVGDPAGGTAGPGSGGTGESGQHIRVRTGSVYYCTSLNDTARRILAEGGKVFLNAFGKVVKGKEVVMHFTPVFWNTSWFRMRPPHTLGILVDPAHPAFRDF